MALTNVRDIGIIDRHNDELHSLTPDSSLEHAVAIAVDQSNGVVFFTDVNREEIWRRDFKTPAPSEVIYRLRTGARSYTESAAIHKFPIIGLMYSSA